MNTLSINFKKIIYSTPFCLSSSIIIGYLTWSILAASSIVTKKLNVPICFYNQENKDIESEAQILVEIIGERAILNSINCDDIAVHIDAEHLKSGDNLYIITRDNLFLAPSVILNNYTPQKLIIKVKDKTKDNING